ncbi:GDCCVxC domain-containing (seleno)protein [Magnetospirillum sp. UT-4]|uniref:GDCCVxC domain-containing (seleno)protein n=1 Tax=Magnetospirillum sp. UT-4 TaxID=2681467 RepID=UPI00137CB8A5|nr:GDCCVxC domain-containing (seleno)protein [Magnetospirillum sp. UT-4]CAA7618338.1 conserved hypothetical protein [Magnetospirillum sp. UT-4]
MIWFTECTITCPACGARRRVEMPGSLWRLDCPACGAAMVTPAGGCCVFCAFGDHPCPDVQASSSCSCGAEGG